VRIELGGAAEAIAAAAAAAAAATESTLIVMGSRRLRGLRAIGSVSRHVVREAGARCCWRHRCRCSSGGQPRSPSVVERLKAPYKYRTMYVWLLGLDGSSCVLTQRARSGYRAQLGHETSRSRCHGCDATQAADHRRLSECSPPGLEPCLRQGARPSPRDDPLSLARRASADTSNLQFWSEFWLAGT
jgi:hypothetical protein